MQSPLRPSIILTGVVLFTIGSINSCWSTVTWWRSALSTLFVGGIAAGLAYIVGVLLKDIAHRGRLRARLLIAEYPLMIKELFAVAGNELLKMRDYAPAQPLLR